MTLEIGLSRSYFQKNTEPLKKETIGSPKEAIPLFLTSVHVAENIISTEYFDALISAQSNESPDTQQDIRSIQNVSKRVEAYIHVRENREQNYWRWVNEINYKLGDHTSSETPIFENVYNTISAQHEQAVSFDHADAIFNYIKTQGVSKLEQLLSRADKHNRAQILKGNLAGVSTEHIRHILGYQYEAEKEAYQSVTGVKEKLTYQQDIRGRIGYALAVAFTAMSAMNGALTYAFQEYSNPLRPKISETTNAPPRNTTQVHLDYADRHKNDNTTLVFPTPHAPQTDFDPYQSLGSDMAAEIRALHDGEQLTTILVEAPIEITEEKRLLWQPVDEEHPLSDSFKAQTVEISKAGIPTSRADIRLRPLVIPALKELITAAHESGVKDIYIGSGERTIDRQRELYAKDARGRAIPGTSQHHTGLAMDFTTAASGFDISLGAHFENTPAGKFLREHAHEHGFVQSYDKLVGNQDDIPPESWHYVYVGKELANLYHNLKSNGWEGNIFQLQTLASSHPELFAQTDAGVMTFRKSLLANADNSLFSIVPPEIVKVV
jgi:D-alanyl-D-alanine carboxypeptidase